MRTIAERLAATVVATSYADLPSEVVQQAKRCVLDQLGVQLFGATLPQPQPALAMVQALGARPESTVVGHDERTAAPYAAYVNAAYGHSCEFDDVHLLAGHPGVCTIPVALALGEAQQRSGRDVIASIVAGYQAMVISCAPIHRAGLVLGWHGTKVSGVFGAAATAANLLGLTAEQTTDALAIAASDASGTMEYDQSGGEVKRLHAAMPARSGLQAAVLAHHGMTGPRTIFEGKRGVYRLFGDKGPTDDESAWLVEHHILDVWFKLYPAVGITHAPLEVLGRLMREEGFSAADIVEVKVGAVDWAAPHMGSIYRPEDFLSAQFSLPFAMGLQLTGHASRDPRSYQDERLWRDGEVLGEAAKVKVHEVVFGPGAPDVGTTVEVSLADGRRLTADQRAPRGHWENPATDDDLTEKFLGLVADVVPADVAESVMADVLRLEELEDISTLMQRLSSTGARGSETTP